MDNSKRRFITGEFQLVPNNGEPCGLCSGAEGDKVMLLANLEAGPLRVCRRCLDTGALNVFLGNVAIDLMERAKAISQIIASNIRPTDEDWQQAAQQFAGEQPKEWTDMGWVNNGEWVGNEPGQAHDGH